MKKVRMMALGFMMMMASVVSTLTIGDRSASALSCPSGSKREGASVQSLAECNIEEKSKENNDDLMTAVNTIINVVLGVIGVVAVIMIIVGGINFTTSNGDAGKVKKAKDTILYAVIGLVVALLAFAIVNFILGNVFGSENTEKMRKCEIVDKGRWDGKNCHTD